MNLTYHVAHSNNLHKSFSKAFNAGCKDKGPKLLTDTSQTDNSCYSLCYQVLDVVDNSSLLGMKTDARPCNNNLKGQKKEFLSDEVEAQIKRQASHPQTS